MTLTRIVPLGTVGWIPTTTRHTTCIALSYDAQLVLLDAGSGVARCLQPPMQAVVKQCTDVLIVLSHFHLDHIIGLTFAPLVFRGKRVTICGPGPLCSGTTTEAVLRRLLSQPLFSPRLEELPLNLQIVDLAPGENYVSRQRIITRVQSHPDPSIGIRIDDLAFVTDTGCDDATVEFVRQVKVLFHDAYYDQRDYEVLRATSGDGSRLRNHGHAFGVADIARRANVGRTYLIHLNPKYGERRLAAMETDARRVLKSVHLAHDLKPIAL